MLRSAPPPLAVGRLVSRRAPLKPAPRRPSPRRSTNALPPLGRYLLVSCVSAGALLTAAIYCACRSNRGPDLPALPADAPASALTESAEMPHPRPTDDPAPHPAVLPTADSEAEPAAEALPPATPEAPAATPPMSPARSMPLVSAAATAPTASSPIATRDDSRLVNSSKLGTRIHFFKDPPDAFARARAENKLVFYVHLSGNFEDDAFT